MFSLPQIHSEMGPESKKERKEKTAHGGRTEGSKDRRRPGWLWEKKRLHDGKKGSLWGDWRRLKRNGGAAILETDCGDSSSLSLSTIKADEILMLPDLVSPQIELPISFLSVSLHGIALLSAAQNLSIWQVKLIQIRWVRPCSPGRSGFLRQTRSGKIDKCD